MLRSEMSADRSPLRKSTGGCSLNSSASSIASFHGTWAQEVINADEGSSRRSSINKSIENQSTEQNDTKGVDDSIPETSQEREISLEFIEDVNEEKFERLLKEEKLKTPFKRRYSQTPSNDSRSESPTDSNNEIGVEGDANGHCNDKDNNQRNKHSYDTQKRSRYNSNGSNTSSNKGREREDDSATLARRQKQIEYGKNTVAYERYVDMVPRNKRTRNHPRTPDKYGKYSRRTFDGLIKVWRKQLHYYDPKPAAGTDNAKDGDSDSD